MKLSDFSNFDREKFLYSPKKIKNLHVFLGNSAKKSLGQNYLIDKNVVDIISNFVQKTLIQNKSKTILEIGCGLGNLTNALLLRGVKIVGVEIDSQNVQFLKNVFFKEIEEGQFLLIQENVVNVSPRDIKTDDRPSLIVGNLPYNMTSSILLHCFSNFKEEGVAGFIFMLQKEVAERITAKSGTSDYGRLTVMCQLFCEKISNVADVSKNSFYPAPKVESRVVFFQLKKSIENIEVEVFSEIVKRAFNMRRKKVGASLLGAKLGVLDELKLQETVSFFDFGNKRAQDLIFEDYLKIYYRYVSLRTVVK